MILIKLRAQTTLISTFSKLFLSKKIFILHNHLKKFGEKEKQTESWKKDAKLSAYKDELEIQIKAIMKKHKSS